MAKNRMVNTKFWSDTYVANLDPLEKLLFLYFITNPFTNICGIYEIPLKQVALDTGIDREALEKVFMPRFKEAGKVYYINGWVYVKNFLKHQRATGNVYLGIQNGEDLVPPEIMAEIRALDGHRGVRGGSEGGLSPISEPKPKPKLEPKEKAVAQDATTPASSFTRFLESVNAKDDDYSLRLDELATKHQLPYDTVEREMDKFVSYWTEPTRSGRKVRWELEKAFEVGRRLGTWFSNVKNRHGKD